MNIWGKRSLVGYETLDPRLQELLDDVLQDIDMSLLCGHRGQKEQNEAFYANTSKVMWPDGKHNKLPSVAVDVRVYPWPEEKYKQWQAMGYLAGVIIERGKQKGLTIRWGGDWDRDSDLLDQNFEDLFHFEIVETPAHAESLTRITDIVDTRLRD